jgi:hypothetical protein
MWFALSQAAKHNVWHGTDPQAGVTAILLDHFNLLKTWIDP